MPRPVARGAGESPLRQPAIAFLALVVAAAFVVVPMPSDSPLDPHGLPLDAPELAMKSVDRPDLDDAPTTDDLDKGTDDAPSTPMRVRLVADGRTLEEPALNGTAIVKGDAGVRVLLLAAARAGARHELRYGGDRPWENDATAVPFESDGVDLVATLTPARLANLTSAHLTFVVATTTANLTSPSYHTGRDDGPFSVVVDLDAPRVAILARAPSGAAIPLVWAGDDNESAIHHYRVMVREGAGAWIPWLAETTERGGTYAGAPGKTFTFRLLAVDGVGHESAWEQTASVAIDALAPPNRAPTLELLSPAEGIAARAIEIAALAIDPDATTPFVKACALVAGVERACAPETTSSIILLDVAALPDGPVTIRVGATDGSASAPEITRTLTLDRAPPLLRDIRAEPADGGAHLSLVSDATAVSAEIARAGGPRVGLVPLASEGGVWTARPPLEPGDYEIVFDARDAAGNVGEVVSRVTIPGDEAPPPGVEGVVAPAPDGPEPVAPQTHKRTPLPLATLLAGALVAVIARRRA